jgi:hypothetical protein
MKEGTSSAVGRHSVGYKHEDLRESVVTDVTVTDVTVTDVTVTNETVTNVRP